MKLIFNVLILFFTLPAFAQNNDRSSKHQEIEAIKVAFFTKKLDLTTVEAKNFWPVYNSYQKAIGAIMRQKRNNIKNSGGTPTEKLNNDLHYDGQILKVKKDYQREFAKVLPADKVLTLYRAEREFREQLIKELKERRHNH